MKNAKITIKDVAREAGVAVATSFMVIFAFFIFFSSDYKKTLSYFSDLVNYIFIIINPVNAMICENDE